jgi:hypothetical protein
MESSRRPNAASLPGVAAWFLILAEIAALMLSALAASMRGPRHICAILMTRDRSGWLVILGSERDLCVDDLPEEFRTFRYERRGTEQRFDDEYVSDPEEGSTSSAMLPF